MNRDIQCQKSARCGPTVLTVSAGKSIGDGHPCFIVAEIGQNHQGDVRLAEKMIETAKMCGVDCVKFQKSNLKEKFNDAALNWPYVGPNSFGNTYGEHKRHLELSDDDYRRLKKRAEEVDIVFSASAMDRVSADFLLDELNVPFLKIGSGDANNIPLLVHVARKGKPIVISSGMQTMDTVKKVYDTLLPINRNICFLQCTSSYPTEPCDVNLTVINTYREAFPDIPIGYSGHEIGIGISVAAVVLGAKVLERHFTLDKTMKGSDHVVSLEPDELRALVREVRAVEAAIVGSGVKEFLSCERPCFDKLGKSVVAATKIGRGEVISELMLCVKVSRPIGWRPENCEHLVGKLATRDIESDETITENDVEDF